jgi:transposase-like protein
MSRALTPDGKRRPPPPWTARRSEHEAYAREVRQQCGEPTQDDAVLQAVELVARAFEAAEQIAPGDEDEQRRIRRRYLSDPLQRMLIVGRLYSTRLYSTPGTSAARIVSRWRRRAPRGRRTSRSSRDSPGRSDDDDPAELEPNLTALQRAQLELRAVVHHARGELDEREQHAFVIFAAAVVAGEKARGTDWSRRRAS